VVVVARLDVFQRRSFATLEADDDRVHDLTPSVGDSIRIAMGMKDGLGNQLESPG
jgi:hypothetical protein